VTSLSLSHQADQTLSPRQPRKGAEEPGVVPAQPGAGRSWASPSYRVGEVESQGLVCGLGFEGQSRCRLGHWLSVVFNASELP